MSNYYKISILKNKVFFYVCTFTVCCCVFFHSSKASAATYFNSGTLTSTNLLTGISDITSIDSFYYNLSAHPAGVEFKLQFSQNGSNWYDSSGIEDAWDTVSTTGGATVDLSGLSWSGANFYYKLSMTSDGLDDATPELDDIAINYTASSGQNSIFFGTNF